MKLTLNEKILKRTDLTFEIVSSIFQSGTKSRFKLSSDKIMTGKVHNGKVHAVVNPPLAWSDPFKSRVVGNIVQNNGQVIIDLKISLDWFIIAFYCIWYFCILLMTYKLIFNDLDFRLEALGILIVYSIFPIGLGKLKVNWDRRRLESWIDKKLKTVPDKG